MDLELAGKTAIVTGGNRGLGKAVARELAREGVDVALAARDVAALEATADELRAETGRTIVPLVCDTGSDESVRAMVAAAVEQLGGIDILVNCAGIPAAQVPPPKLAEIDDDVFWPDVNVKVMGYLRCTREAVPHIAARGGGVVLNVGGMAVRSPGSTVGGMRNVAISAMTKNLADELAPQRIRVLVVHPGTFRSPQFFPDYVAKRAALEGLSEDEIERKIAAGNLLGRILEVEEVAQAIVFLASPKAISINGDAVPVAGGLPGSIHY